MNQSIYTLRCVVFYIISTISLILFVVTGLLISPFLNFKQRFQFLTGYCHSVMWALRVICSIKIDVTGLEHINEIPNGIVISNHQSTWETFFLQQHFMPQISVIKKELLRIPFFGWGLALLAPITVDRRQKRSALKQLIEQGTAHLEKGHWVLIFPEGTRSNPGTIGTFSVGGAMLASKTGYPVIPIAHNAGDHWPVRKFLKTPGTINVCVGAPIKTAGRSSRDINNEVETWIKMTYSRLS